jgi:Tfp pilus assembly protein PilF
MSSRANPDGVQETEAAFRSAVADLIAGRLSSALENLERCLACDPDFAPAHSIRAAVHLRQGLLEEALQDINRALELRPEETGDLHNRAVIWTALERYEHAIEDYEAVLRIDPGSAGTLNNLAWVLVTAKNPRVRDGPRALAYALEAVRRGDTPAWLDTLAAAYAECRDFASAVSCEEEAYRRSRPPNEVFRSRLSAYRKGRTFTEWREANAGM